MFSCNPDPIEASEAYLGILAIRQVSMGLEIVLGVVFQRRLTPCRPS
jgi:hypothetical protein